MRTACGRCCSTCSAPASTGARRSMREAERFGLPPDLADAWRAEYQPQLETVRSGKRPWVNLDVLHRIGLDIVLSDARPHAAERRPRRARRRPGTASIPWPDVVEGLTKLKETHIIAPCSNGHIAQSVNLAKYAKLPWDAILGAEIARAYKPDPRVYLEQRVRARPRAARGLHGRRAPRRPASRPPTSGLQTAFVRAPRRGPGPAVRRRRRRLDFVELACAMKHLIAGWHHGRRLPLRRRLAAVEVQPGLGPDQPRCCSSGCSA